MPRRGDPDSGADCTAATPSTAADGGAPGEGARRKLLEWVRDFEGEIGSMLKCCTRFLTSVILAGAAWMVPAMASAQVAFTTEPVNMRAGPDRRFPLVAWLPGGVGVTVIGCIDGWRWCDVVAGPNRGWVFARFLTFQFRNAPVTVWGNGAMLGLPLITFSIGPYWDSFYRGRPWYGRQSYWSNWAPPPPAFRPPPPRPPTVRPPPARPPQGPGMGPPSRPGSPPGQGPGASPPPRPGPPPGQGPGMGPGSPPANITRPPR